MASASAPAAAPAAAPGPASRRLMKTITRIRKLGPDAGALSLKVDEGSSTTVTTTNPDSKTSRLARESFVSDRVLDESVGQVCCRGGVGFRCCFVLLWLLRRRFFVLLMLLRGSGPWAGTRSDGNAEVFADAHVPMAPKVACLCTQHLASIAPLVRARTRSPSTTELP